MRLLERERELAELGDAVRAAIDGSGCVLLVHGEAGIGKSSLVGALRDRPPAGSRVLVGACDALSTPRTLGPLRDLTPFVGSRLGDALRAGDREEVLTALHEELASAPGTVLVVEDVHWSDEATLDVLRFLGRRIDELRAVLVLTYRDDELDRDHPLARLLGDLRVNVRHLPLRRLSAAAVGELTAHSGVDPDRVYALTGGNPYFASEIIASADAAHVPRTVVDAVTARLRRLDRATQAHVEQLAVVPSAVSMSELAHLVPGGLGALGAAEEAGLITVRPEAVQFRHRADSPRRRRHPDRVPAHRAQRPRARDAARRRRRPRPHRLPCGRKRATSTRSCGGPRGRLAMRRSSGAHRQAAEHYRAALAHLGDYAEADRTELLENFAIEVYTLGRGLDAVEAQTEVIRLRREQADPAALGASLRWLSRFQWLAGNRAAAESAAREASTVVAGLDDRGLLAIALSNEAQLAMLANDLPRTIDLATRAIALAKEIGEQRALSHALNNLGSRPHAAEPRRGDRGAPRGSGHRDRRESHG